MLIDAAVTTRAHGIVNAGAGHTAMASLVTAQQNGVAIVTGSHMMTGIVRPTSELTKAGFTSAGMHSPHRARILMQPLPKTNDPKKIQRIFNEY